MKKVFFTLAAVCAVVAAGCTPTTPPAAATAPTITVAATADDIARLVVVAVIVAIDVAGSAEEAFEFSAILRGETAVGEGLVKRTEGVGDVVEFGVDGDGHFAQSDDQAEDRNGGDQDEFGRNDETSFVIPERLQHCVNFLCVS